MKMRTENVSITFPSNCPKLVQLCKAASHLGPKEWKIQNEEQDQVTQKAQNGISKSDDERETVCQRHNALCHWSAKSSVLRKVLICRAPVQNGSTDYVRSSDTILDTNIHTLSTGWTVDVCRIADKECSAIPVFGSQSVMDVETR